MTSVFGNEICISISGESHGEYLEGIIRGMPKGEKIDESYIAQQMARRAPGQDATATPRSESDSVIFTSGIENGVTTGDDITLIIKNTNTRSSDYNELQFTPRPSHADYPAFVKYGGTADMRGSGHFSGRLTAVTVAIGAVCRCILKSRGITIAGHIYNIGDCFDTAFNPADIPDELMDSLSKKYFSTISANAADNMRKVILSVAEELDSIGGCVEVAVKGMPVGVGNHMFGGVENIVSSMVYSIPAVKGVSFGAGFDFSYLRGSEANDPYYFKDGNVVTATNNCGGICGGMTTGMPIIVKAALKPTPSIFKEQNTVNLKTGQNTLLQIKGRHDPCIVPRALPGIEAAVAIAVTMLLKKDGKL